MPAPATAATGSISKALANLANSIAGSSTFQGWVGAVTQAAALLSVHFETLTAPAADDGLYTKAELEALRPYALITTAGHTSEVVAGGGGSSYMRSGAMLVRFEQDIDPDDTEADGEVGRKLLNTVGDIVADMETLSGTAGYLAFDGLDMAEGYQRTAQNELSHIGDAVLVELSVRWRGI